MGQAKEPAKKKKYQTELPELEIDWRPDRGSAAPVYQQIVDYVSRRISGGDWPVGSRLPSQRRLAQQFGVNRSTISAAMDELYSYGVLEGDRGRGTYVASNTWSLLMSSAPPDWGSYIRSGSFRANVPTIQLINKLEFERDVLRLGTGELAPDLFPREIMDEVFSRLPARIPSLNYLEPLGLAELREVLARRLCAQGIETSPSGILITSGSLQALQLISVCMLKPGSTVYTEAPSYVKSLQVFQSAGMRLSGLPMDSEGLVHWNIPQKRESGLLYTIPTFHNPTGTVMSAQRREALLRFCQNTRLPIIEDNAYGELWFDEEPPRPIKTLDKNGVILYLGTVSKTIAPGLRIGWLAGPRSVTERLGDVKMQIDYGASSLSQWALAELLSGGLYDQYLASLRVKLKERRDLALRALDLYFKDLADWNIPQGSFYIWLRLKVSVPTDRLFQRAMEERILINPGSIYDYNKNNAVRLSYAYAAEDQLEDGIRRLAKAVRSLI
ncbi:aminotransferase-like domain-containing protein [Bacilliculturomica massiliensis]|uniref:aminotransferase-like domain-containing protein n=1 Tax=Bacilliculturomica massiliensis TaxID=1917867 RepID=UPI0010314AF0|nr:PLP-dependent aminotransferase family protein [Bacilliculturomica massiliensis]